jgi:hypothetical protein
LTQQWAFPTTHLINYTKQKKKGWLMEMVGFKEEDGRDIVHMLDKVLADEEAADCKGQTGTYLFVNFQSVCVIDGYCNWCFF